MVIYKTRNVILFKELKNIVFDSSVMYETCC